MRLRDEVAIVTGGGRGIGRAIARKLAQEGAAVVVASRTASEVEAAAKEITESGGRAVAVAADVSQESGCDAIVAAARRHLGCVDILVNNAGIYGPVRPIEEIASEEWDAVLKVNLRGAYLMMRKVLPEMYRRGSGAIVNITSIAGKAAFGLNGPYAASKAAVMGLTRTVAAEAARKGVRVNAISPGPVLETKMSQELGRELARHLGLKPEEGLARAAEGTLQGRPQTAEEIAAALVFLVSDESSGITGQILNVDGGMAFY